MISRQVSWLVSIGSSSSTAAEYFYLLEDSALIQ